MKPSTYLKNLQLSTNWRAQYNPLRGLTIAQLVAMLEAAERGNYARLQWLYRFVEAELDVAGGVAAAAGVDDPAGLGHPFARRNHHDGTSSTNATASAMIEAALPLIRTGASVATGAVLDFAVQQSSTRTRLANEMYAAANAVYSLSGGMFPAPAQFESSTALGLQTDDTVTCELVG